MEAIKKILLPHLSSSRVKATVGKHLSTKVKTRLNSGVLVHLTQIKLQQI